MTPSWLVIASIACGPASSETSPRAEPVAVEPGDDAAPDGSPDSAPAIDPERLERVEAHLAELAAQSERVRKDNERLRADNERLEAEAKAQQEQSEALERRIDAIEEQQRQDRAHIDRMLPLSGRLGGYLDIGFFYVSGDGSGIRPDLGHRVFPEYQDVVPDSWVFMGDPLSTQINSRGDPADTSESRAVLLDSVDSQGRSSFIANALNLDLVSGIGDNIVVEGMVDFIGRNRDISSPDGVFLGDYVNVKLAYVNYIVPTRRLDLDLYAGKFDSVVGYEYRVQESPDRTTVTPSLLCRYTCGRPVGLKGRAKFLPNRSLIVALSMTNGSTFREGFGMANEVDTNDWKTLAGRLSYRFPVGAGLEIGASGQYGAQDLQPSDDVHQWQHGFDLHLDVRGVELTGEFIRGRVRGDTAEGEATCGLAPCLRFTAAYGLLGYRALNWLMPYVRVDWRDAVHLRGASFVYVSNLVRFTPGARFDLGTHIAVKLEYTHNRELGRIPQFANDTLTSSLVAKI